MDWLSPHFTIQQLAAEDICREEVRKHLAADPVLRGVFDQILSLSFMPPDVGRIPALVVTPLTNDETPAAGSRVANFSLYVVARFPYPRHETAASGPAGLPTLFRHIRTVLSAPGVKSLQIQRGAQMIPLVRRFEPATGITYAPVPVEPGATNVIFDAAQRFDLEATLDPVTRELWNLAVNG